MTLMRPVLVMMAALMLGGCAAITSISDATRPLEAYELRAPSDPVNVQGSLQRHLVIETPVASGALDTDRIMIRPGSFQTAYLPGARWVDTAPVMMQTILVRSLNDTGALRYVGRRPLSGSADYVLMSELTDFQAEIGSDGEAVTARIRLTARLVREEDAAILGTRTVETTVAIPSTETDAVVAGLDAVTKTALRDLSIWTLRRMGLGVAG